MRHNNSCLNVQMRRRSCKLPTEHTAWGRRSAIIHATLPKKNSKTTRYLHVQRIQSMCVCHVDTRICMFSVLWRGTLKLQDWTLTDECVGTELKLQNFIPWEDFHSVARKAKLTSWTSQESSPVWPSSTTGHILDSNSRVPLVIPCALTRRRCSLRTSTVTTTTTTTEMTAATPTQGRI